MGAHWPVAALTKRSGSGTSKRANLGLHFTGIPLSSTKLLSHPTAAPCSVAATTAPYGCGMWKGDRVFASLGATWPASSISTGVRMGDSWPALVRMYWYGCGMESAEQHL